MPGADGPADVTEMKHPVRSSGLFPQLLQGGTKTENACSENCLHQGVAKPEGGCEEFREHELLDAGASVSVCSKGNALDLEQIIEEN